MTITELYESLGGETLLSMPDSQLMDLADKNNLSVDDIKTFIDSKFNEIYEVDSEDDSGQSDESEDDSEDDSEE